jgi:hypothetical protein
MKKGSKSKVSLPNLPVENTNERFVIEVEKKNDLYSLTFAGCLSQKTQ